MIEEFLQFVGRLVLYGGGAAAIAYALFVFLGKKLIEDRFATRLQEYKSAQNKELENVRYRISTIFSRVTKIHEKEYEVLPTAWGKLNDARDYIGKLVSPFQQYPDFSHLKEQEIKRILTNYKWKEHQIEDLINTPDRNKHFQDKMFWYHLNEAKSKFSDFHTYITRNRIFLSQDLKEQFNKADVMLWDSLIMREVGEEAKDYKMIIDSHINLKENIELVLSTIERLVQERLKYNEAL